MIRSERFVFVYFMSRNFLMNFDSTWFIKRIEKVTFYKDTSEFVFKFKDGSETVLKDEVKIGNNYPQWYQDILNRINEEGCRCIARKDSDGKDDFYD